MPILGTTTHRAKSMLHRVPALGISYCGKDFMSKTLPYILGVILVLFGLFGFISNPLVGANALFLSDAVHNVMHLIFGLGLLSAAYWAHQSYGFWLKGMGALLLLLGLIGLCTVSSLGGILLGIATTNGASNWFNFIMGGVILFVARYTRA
jgi:hypothetical protein